MDIQAIHTALVAIWPSGIPREQYVALAGIFKVCSDLEMTALQEKIQQRSSPVDQPVEGTLQAYVPDGSGRFVRREDLDIKTPRVGAPPPTRPTTPKILKSRQKRLFVSEATISQVKGILAGGPRTKEDIARQTERSLRAVRYALAALQERGLVKRIPAKAKQPHLYQLA